MERISIFYKKIDNLEPIFLAWTTNKKDADEFSKFRPKLLRLDKDASSSDIQLLQLDKHNLEIKPIEVFTKDENKVKKVSILATIREHQNLQKTLDGRIKEVFYFNNIIPSKIFKHKQMKAFHSLGYGKHRNMFTLDFPFIYDELTLFIKIFIEEEYPYNILSMGEFLQEDW